MDALIGEVLGQARGIAEDVQRRLGVRMRTATVTSASPLLIRYDGEDAASVVSPRTVARVAVGDRVAVAKTRGQATILGVLGGGSGGGGVYTPRGVKGDGAADDTAGWNTFLASLPPGAVVQCPPGARYRLTGPVGIPHPVTIQGGEFIPHTSGPCLDIASSAVTVRGTVFTSPSAALPEPTHRIIRAVGTSAARLRGLTIDNVTINRTRNIGVWIEWAEDVKVTNTSVTDFQYGGVMLASVARGEVSSSVIRNGLQEGGIANAYGIAATDLVNTLAGRSSDVVITRNVIDNIPRWEGIDTHGGERIAITHNIVTRCYDGISAIIGNSSRVAAPKDIVIEGNIIDAMGIPSPRSGIRLYGKAGGDQVTAAVGPNIIRGYMMDVEAAEYSRGATIIAPQATDIASGYSPHRAPFRQYVLSSRVNIATATFTRRTVPITAGGFTIPPLVFLTPQTDGAHGWTWRVESVSTTEVTIYGTGPAAAFDIRMGIWCIQMGSASLGGIPLA